MNKNNSVEKIFGQLVAQKQVCDQQHLKKAVCDRKASDTEKVMIEVVSRQREFDRKKNVFFCNSLSKNCC